MWEWCEQLGGKVCVCGGGGAEADAAAKSNQMQKTGAPAGVG